MEVDDLTADDHEISPRCYVLDTGVQGVEDMIWVRSECSNLPRNSTPKVCPTHCLHVLLSQVSQELVSFADVVTLVLLTYQLPCLGKSFWRWYALRVCCAKKRPVILYFCGICCLFVDEGVFEQPTNFRSSHYKIVIWTLVDSADGPSGPPIGLISHGTQHFVLYTTSPTPSGWDKIHQTMLRAVCVMNPWTKAEILRAQVIKIMILRNTHSLYCAQCSFPCSRRALTSHRSKILRAWPYPASMLWTEEIVD